MKEFILIVNYRNTIANGYRDQRTESCEIEDLAMIIRDAESADNNGDVKNVTIQVLNDGKYIGNLDFVEMSLEKERYGELEQIEESELIYI